MRAAEGTVRTLCHAARSARGGLGGIPVEYKGGTVPSPDQRRSYS